MLKLTALIAVLACSLGLALTGCGDDDDETTETVTETATTSTGTPVEVCPDTTLDLGGPAVSLTDISTTVGCENVAALATDVLSRDDCVEESPAGSNACETQGYICTTTIPGEGAVVFAVSCTNGSRHVSFSQLRN